MEYFTIASLVQSGKWERRVLEREGGDLTRRRRRRDLAAELPAQWAFRERRVRGTPWRAACSQTHSQDPGSMDCCENAAPKSRRRKERQQKDPLCDSASWRETVFRISVVSVTGVYQEESVLPIRPRATAFHLSSYEIGR